MIDNKQNQSVISLPLAGAIGLFLFSKLCNGDLSSLGNIEYKTNDVQKDLTTEIEASSEAINTPLEVVDEDNENEMDIIAEAVDETNVESKESLVTSELAEDKDELCEADPSDVSIIPENYSEPESKILETTENEAIESDLDVPENDESVEEDSGTEIEVDSETDTNENVEEYFDYHSLLDENNSLDTQDNSILFDEHSAEGDANQDSAESIENDFTTVPVIAVESSKVGIEPKEVKPSVPSEPEFPDFFADINRPVNVAEINNPVVSDIKVGAINTEPTQPHEPIVFESEPDDNDIDLSFLDENSDNSSFASISTATPDSEPVTIETEDSRDVPNVFADSHQSGNLDFIDTLPNTNNNTATSVKEQTPDLMANVEQLHKLDPRDDTAKEEYKSIMDFFSSL